MSDQTSTQPGQAAAEVTQFRAEPAETNGDGKDNDTPGRGGAPPLGWDAIVPVLATIVTGAGLLGFVALFGGAILFARADELGLPAAQSVALLPRSSLLATGGEFLVLVMLIALSAVAVLWILTKSIEPVAKRYFDAREDRRRMQERTNKQSAVERADEAVKARELEAQALEEALAERVEEQKDAERAKNDTADALERAISARETADAAAREVEVPMRLGKLTGSAADDAQRLLDQAATARQKADELGTEAEELVDGAARAETAVRDATSAREQADEALTQRRGELETARAALRDLDTERKTNTTRRLRWVRYAILCLGLLAAEIVFLIPAGISDGHVGVLLAVSAVTSALALLVYHHTRRHKFIWFGVCVFLAIGVFRGWALNYSIKDAPELEPAAALVAGQAPVVGAYLTQTKDRVYLGLPDQEGSDYRLAAIPRTSVVALAVGRLTARDNALREAKEIAGQLCRTQPLPVAVKELRAAPQCAAIAAMLATRLAE